MVLLAGFDGRIYNAVKIFVVSISRSWLFVFLSLCWPD